MQSEQSSPGGLRIEPLGGSVGAMVHGLDLHNLSDEVSAGLNDALHRHGVLFCRPGAAAEVSASQFVSLAEAIGEILIYPYRPRNKSVDDERISYIEGDGATKGNRKYFWHTDGTPEECPPRAALLNPLIVAERGGDTMWASMYAAYEALSDKYQRFLDGLDALHSTDRMADKLGPMGKEVFGDGARCVHPVVLTDPLTGRRILYVNEDYTERIVGLSDAESRSILELLFKHVNTPEFHIRWQWQQNDIAIWDERVTQHRVVPDWVGKRRLRRITIKGERPV